MRFSSAHHPCHEWSGSKVRYISVKIRLIYLVKFIPLLPPQICLNLRNSAMIESYRKLNKAVLNLHLPNRGFSKIWGQQVGHGDFLGFMDSVISFIQNNTVIAIGIAVILLFLIYRKPKVFFGMLFLGLILAVLFYLITSMAGSGSKQKKRLLSAEEEKQSDTSR